MNVKIRTRTLDYVDAVGYYYALECGEGALSIAAVGLSVCLSVPYP